MAPFFNPMPSLVAHADWSCNPKKRWIAKAQRCSDGSYRACAPRQVIAIKDLLNSFCNAGGLKTGCLVGFDFPSGLPRDYARQVGVDNFLTWLTGLGEGLWKDFYRVAENPEMISLQRPFYPQRPVRASQQHLLEGLNVDEIDQLRRVCERARTGRRAAAPLFWTLGGQQVGKAAISGWRDVLGPAMRSQSPPVSIWPFSGPLSDLIRPGRVTIVETYPAEFYTHFGLTAARGSPGKRSGKRVQADRARWGIKLLDWAQQAGVHLTTDLQGALADGFGPARNGDDPCDAVIGLFGMLNIVLGHRMHSEPSAPDIRYIEGWIFGQEIPPTRTEN